MSSVPVKQNRFQAGQVTPLLFGDREWSKYGMSLRTCKNWLPISQGALVRRTGTVYKAHTKADAAVRGIPFIFADGNTYVLEFGAGYIRFFKNGNEIPNTGAPYEVTPTPWTAAMLPYLKFAQVGNTVTICYGGEVPGVAAVAPQDLVHTTGVDSPWALHPTPLKAPALTWGFGGSALSFAIPAFDAAATYGMGDRVRYQNQSWVSIQTANHANNPVLGSLYWVLSTGGSTNTGGNAAAGNPVDSLHFADTWQWAQTAVFQDSNGITYESAPTISPAVTDALSPDRPIACQAIALATELQNATYTLLYYRFYRGKNGVWGWIADLVAPFAAFSDAGRAPDFSQQPPAGTNPFTAYSVGPPAVPGYPAVVAHYDQRRVFAGTLTSPQSIFTSKAGDFYNYDRPTPGADTDALSETLVSEVLEQIRSLVGKRKLLAMTGQGEWTLSGANAGPITRSSKDFRKQSSWGSNWLNPLVIGIGILFNTAKSNMVRDFFPLYGGIYSDVWDGDEISWQARHFLDGHTIVDWAYQSTPYGVVWAVRDDGLLLSITYDRKREVIAWAQHTTGTGDGFFENVVVVPEPPEDAVYFVVRRVINGLTYRFWERLNDLVLPRYKGVQDTRYGVFLDAAATYDGHNVGAVTMQLSGGVNYLAGDRVLCTASAPWRPGPAGWGPTDAGTSLIVFDPDGAAVQVKVVDPCLGPYPQLAVLVELQTALNVDQTLAWVVSPTTNWGDAVNTINLPHLNGYVADSGDKAGVRGVAALADGNSVQGAFAGGTLTLVAPAVVIQAGILYNSDIELLDAWHPSAEIRNRFKKMVRAGFEVAGARGLWAGDDFDHLYEWEELAVEDSYALGLKTGYFEEIIGDEWNKDGRISLRQFDPLPVALLSVLREMELGGT